LILASDLFGDLMSAVEIRGATDPRYVGAALALLEHGIDNGLLDNLQHALGLLLVGRQPEHRVNSRRRILRTLFDVHGRSCFF